MSVTNVDHLYVCYVEVYSNEPRVLITVESGLSLSARNEKYIPSMPIMIVSSDTTTAKIIILIHGRTHKKAKVYS